MLSSAGKKNRDSDHFLIGTVSKKWSLSLFFIFFMSGTLFADEVSTPQVMTLLNEKIKSITSYSADVAMTMSTVGDKVTMNGNLFYKSPEKMRMEMTMSGPMPMTQSPAGTLSQQTISDGKVLWVYMPQMNTASRWDLEKIKGTKAEEAVERPGDLLHALDEMDMPTLKYAGKGEANGASVYIFEGFPKMSIKAQDVEGLSKMKVFIGADDGLARRIVVYDKDGKETMVQDYTNIKVNVAVADSLFQFTPPAGVQVVDVK